MAWFRRSASLVGALVLLSSLAVAARPEVAEAAPTACDDTGYGCAVGMTGPGGGVVFYDAGSQQWWGRFLEAKMPEPTTEFWSQFIGSIYAPNESPALQRRAMAIGMGRHNTATMRQKGSPLVSKHFPETQDWFLPSKDELDALYNSPIWQDRARPKVPVWTSTESESGFAWYQLFADGTQFTDAQGIIPKLKGNTQSLKSPKHTGSNFAEAQMNVVKVRSFPAATGNMPEARLVTAVSENVDCSKRAMNCQVGDRGPAGGIIVYDAGAQSIGGRYYEIAPESCEKSGYSFSTKGLGAAYLSADMRQAGKAIGSGAANSARLLSALKSPAVAVVATLKCGGYEDWFLPSKDELNEAFRHLSHSRKGLQLTPVGGFQRGYYWTSSDYNGSTAWAQYFADGQQFDRVQTLSRNKQAPNRPFYIRPMRRFAAGEVSSGIGLTNFLRRSIVISVNWRDYSARSISGVTTGITKGATVVVDLFAWPEAIKRLEIEAEVDALGRFEVDLTGADSVIDGFLAVAYSGDLSLFSNFVVGVVRD
jgi:hypothetical protein